MKFLATIICGVLFSTQTSAGSATYLFNAAVGMGMGQQTPGKPSLSNACFKTVTDSTTGNQVKVSVSYPLSKNDLVYFLFINRKFVAKINPGERTVITLKTGNTYRVCISNNQLYQEPKTLSPNSRTLSMKAGKQYYFSITGKGALEYEFNPQNGEKVFNKTTDYKSSAPVTITAAQTGEIPSL